MSGRLQAFREERERLNERILEAGTQTTRRFFNLDGAAYRDGALDARTKELAGTRRVDGPALRRLHRLPRDPRPGGGCDRAGIAEVFDVALVVGGSIVIPHLRRARERLDALLAEQAP